MRPNKESVLLKTSAATDIQCSGGVISITGLKKVSKSNIFDIKQVKYRAETAQVIRVGTSSYTPTADTVYKVLIGDVNRFQSGWEETLKPYSYRTPVVLTTLGATAALQREAIHLALVAAINADASNKVVAASLLTGTGFSVTDDGSYYPVYSQGMSNVKGVSTVIPVTNTDGSGFAESDYSITTPGVIGVGVGAYLAAQLPVIDFMNGNLVSGVIDTPPLTTAGAAATSGQNYDVFVIESYQTQAAWSVSGQLALVQRWQEVWVDNGTGSATTNLTGFKAFERVMHKLMVQQYQRDASCVQEFFDKPIAFQDPLGAAPTGTADTLGWMISPYGSLNRTNIGTQTIVAPVLNATGLLIDQDDTATKGAHYSANQQTLGDQSFIVGKTAPMVAARVVMADYTDAAFILGFRKKEAYNAVFNAYTDYATIGNGSSAAGTTYINGDFFVTRAELNGGGILETVSAVAPTDAVSYMCWVKVDINGAVTAFVNGTSYPIYSTGTTQMVFDAGDELIPCFQIVNIGGGDPACSISEFFAVASDKLIS